jgi:hypothetical protein
MRQDFFTIADLGYAARTLVLYRSLATVCSDFRLRVLCLDDETKNVFGGLSLSHLEPIAIAELEEYDSDLLAVKPTRTAAEYSWTAKACASLYLFQVERDIELLTYVDSDLMFFSSPSSLFDELGTSSILIVSHRNPQRARWWDAWGIYNAGFVTFRRDPVGFAALRWWRDRCLEWCYDRLEDGKSGDQTYLDDWPTRFPGTHVLQHRGGGLGPWNVGESRLERVDETVLVDGVPLVFFHYATLRIFRDTFLRRLRLLPRSYRFTLGRAPLVWTIHRSYGHVSRHDQDLVWDPYLRCLDAAWAAIPSAMALTPPPLRDVAAHATPRQVLRSVALARSRLRAVLRSLQQRGRRRGG